MTCDRGRKATWQVFVSDTPLPLFFFHLLFCVREEETDRRLILYLQAIKNDKNSHEWCHMSNQFHNISDHIGDKKESISYKIMTVCMYVDR